MKVKLELVDGGRCVVTTAARVAWSDACGRFGVEFLDISPESRGDLQQWLRLSSQPQARAEGPSAVKPQLCEDVSAAETSSDALFASAAERAILLTRADGAAIALDDNGGLRCRAAVGEIAPLVCSRIDSQSGLTGACLRSGQVMRCNSTDSDPLVNRESCHSLGISSIIAAPIVHAGCVVGLIEVFSRRSHAFDNGDCYALERLAEAVAESAAVRASLMRSETARTSEIALHAAEAELRRSAIPADTAPPSLSREAGATAAGDDASPLAGLLLSAGYEFSMAEKLMLHKRAIFWSVAGVLVALSLWFSFENRTQWGSNGPLPTAANLQIAGRNGRSPTPNVPSRASTSTISTKHDSLEDVRQRAQSGDLNAQFELGAAYARGQGSAESYTEAVKWLTRSADQGNVTATAALGAFYWAGRGVTQDYVDAYVWSSIAEAEGDEASSYRVKILQTRMPPTELDEARRRAAAWLHTHGKQIGVKRGAPTYR